MSPFTAARANGAECPIEASVSCLDMPAGRAYALIVRSISERRRHEQARREQAVSLERTMRELRALNEELDERQLDRTMRELRALNEELDERQAALEQAMSARSRLYASMSHERRTPINAALGYSTLLHESIYGPPNDKQQEGIERTQKAARRLPNLLSDAIEFGGGKPARVICLSREEGGAIVDVADQRPGIAPEDEEWMFREFVQLGRTPRHEGTGLPISRRLDELLHGRVEVESRVGNGSTFRLVLPATADVRQGGRARLPRREEHEVTPRAADERPSGPVERSAPRSAGSAASG